MGKKKEEIYQEAAKLFQEKGYKAASMRDLAEQVELKVSSLYSHIGSKEEILQKICFDNAQQFIVGIEKIEKETVDIVDKIKGLLKLHIQIAIENPTSITVFNDEWRHLSSPHLENFLTLRKDYEQRFKDLIKQGIEEKVLQDIDANIALYTLLNSVRWVHYWYKPKQSITQEALEETILSLLLNGMKITNH